MTPAARAPRPSPDDRRPRVRQHQRRRPQINAIRDDLIRRGLPVRRAVRYARELQAHWEDVRDELLGTGVAKGIAESGADERLGSAASLIQAAVRAHRRETISGRHPILGFVIVPFALVPLLPVLLIMVIVLPVSLIFGRADLRDDGDDALAPPAALTPQESASVRHEVRATYAAWHAWAYGMPAALTAIVHRRTRRRMLSSAWAWAASASVAVSAGFQKGNLLWRPVDRPAFRFSFGGWPTPSIMIAVLASATVAAWLIRGGKRQTPAQEDTLMLHPRRLASFLLCCALTAVCAGCVGPGTTHVSTERVAGAPTTRPADRLVVVMRVEPDGFWDRHERKELSDDINRSIRGLPHTTVIDFATSNRPGTAGARAADEEALRVAREQGADRACVVDVRALWTSFAIPLLPPGWQLKNTLNYSVRAFDVTTGERVFSRTRSRSDGGFYAVHVPDLQKYFDRGLREDLTAAAGTNAPE